MATIKVNWTTLLIGIRVAVSVSLFLRLPISHHKLSYLQHFTSAPLVSKGSHHMRVNCSKSLDFVVYSRVWVAIMSIKFDVLNTLKRNRTVQGSKEFSLSIGDKRGVLFNLFSSTCDTSYWGVISCRSISHRLSGWMVPEDTLSLGHRPIDVNWTHRSNLIILRFVAASARY